MSSKVNWSERPIDVPPDLLAMKQQFGFPVSLEVNSERDKYEAVIKLFRYVPPDDDDEKERWTRTTADDAFVHYGVYAELRQLLRDKSKVNSNKALSLDELIGMTALSMSTNTDGSKWAEETCILECLESLNHRTAVGHTKAMGRVGAEEGGSLRRNASSLMRRAAAGSGRKIRPTTEHRGNNGRSDDAIYIYVGRFDPERIKSSRVGVVTFDEPVHLHELSARRKLKSVVFLLGPNNGGTQLDSCAFALVKCLEDGVFCNTFVNASNEDAILHELDRFLDRNARIVLKKDLESHQATARKANFEDHFIVPIDASTGVIADSKRPSTVHDHAMPQLNQWNPLQRKGKLFYGIFKEVQIRLPHYWSDYRDALNFRVITTTIFMLFASLAPAITFGGLMGTYTDNTMGITETLMAQCICGVLWGLFAAQPLLIMSPTGPVLVFESSLFSLCHAMNIDFLTIRAWAGFWLMLLALITVMFEGSAFVRFVTRFTEDIFATLISMIFIAESINFLTATYRWNPVVDLDYYEDHTCPDTHEHSRERQGHVARYHTKLCSERNQPDTFLLTFNLMILTFVLAFGFKKLRESVYFGRQVRRAIGDFGVLLSIVIVTVIALVLFDDTYLERIHMPTSFGFTNLSLRGHGHLVSLSLRPNQWWGVFMAIIPAILVYILLFVETEITELILGRKERGLKKGTGFHLDILLVGILSCICGLLGLPWMCAAGVQSLAHASALTVVSKEASTGKLHIVNVVEQRVTTICVSLLVGACAFGGPYVSKMPLAVLFGVFLYLGIMNLAGVQFVKRCILLFIPHKYHPADELYCEHVSMWRMHAFTAIQVICLAVVYLVKHFKITALAFPFVLLLICLLRAVLIPRMFTEDEIQHLDGHEVGPKDELAELTTVQGGMASAIQFLLAPLKGPMGAARTAPTVASNCPQRKLTATSVLATIA